MEQSPSPAHEPAAASERGFTLIELLVVLLLGIIVIFIPLQLVGSVFSDSSQVTSRTEAASRAQLALRPLITDLRHATAATVTNAGGSATAVMEVPVRSAAGAGQTFQSGTTFPLASETVTWTCTAGATCTRRAGGGPAVIRIEAVTSAMFAATSPTGTTATVNPAYVSVTLETRLRDIRPPGPARTMTVTDGVGLRNFTT